MAIQIDCEELKNCPGYLEWIAGKLSGEDTVTMTLKPISWPDIFQLRSRSSQGVEAVKTAFLWQREAFWRTISVLFSVDYVWDENIKEDEIRATDAIGLRHRYAEETGDYHGKSDRDIDRIWKSIHGKCSVLEFLVQLCIRLDGMVNEDEPEAMIGLFFGILLKNLGLDAKDFLNSEAGQDEVNEVILGRIGRFLSREYREDGSGGGLFPLRNWSEKTHQDQRKVSIWYQMNTWLAEHLDDEEHFCE